MNLQFDLDIHLLHDFELGNQELFEVNTSYMVNVKTIGMNFMRGCKSLEAFESSGLTAITTVSDGFLHECTLLTYFACTGLTALRSISGSFNGCTSVISFDTTGLRALKSISGAFLLAILHSDRCHDDFWSFSFLLHFLFWLIITFSRWHRKSMSSLETYYHARVRPSY